MQMKPLLRNRFATIIEAHLLVGWGEAPLVEKFINYRDKTRFLIMLLASHQVINCRVESKHVGRTS
jgi:hypothetical protein